MYNNIFHIKSAHCSRSESRMCLAHGHLRTLPASTPRPIIWVMFSDSPGTDIIWVTFSDSPVLRGPREPRTRGPNSAFGIKIPVQNVTNSMALDLQTFYLVLEYLPSIATHS